MDEIAIFLPLLKEIWQRKLICVINRLNCDTNYNFFSLKYDRLTVFKNVIDIKHLTGFLE